MKRYSIEIKGVTPLLQHAMPQDALYALLGAKTSKKKVTEELTPREIAEKHSYKGTDGVFYVPTEYVSGAFAHVAGDYKQRNSARKSLKTVARGVFAPEASTSSLLDLEDKPIKAFEVDIKKATNHQKGAVAVCRPRFDRWKTKFVVSIDDSILTPDVCLEILNDAGRRSGIGSFRVSRGGNFGQFVVTEFKEL